MIEAKITLNVRPAGESVNIIDVQGDLTGTAEETLMSAFNEASGSGTKAIVLNMEGLEYMNSSGIGLLVTMLIRVQRQKQSLLAFGLTDHYQQIFELTRLNEAIGIYDSESAAVGAAG